MTAPNGPILFNSSTGSDTQASGLGPATAVYGAGASTSAASAVVTGIDTTGVSAGDLLWVQSSSGRQFSIIASVDSGTQVTCDDTFANTEGSRTWAIGGKRQYIGSATSRRIQEAGGAAGDGKPGWKLRLESGHTETLSDTYRFWIGGDTTDGRTGLEGDPNASVKPVLTFSNNGTAFHISEGTSSVAHVTLSNFVLLNSNATKTASIAIENQEAMFIACNIDIGSPSNSFWRGIRSNGSRSFFYRCVIDSTVFPGISIYQQGYQAVMNCVVKNGSSFGITTEVGGFEILNSIVYGCGDSGLYLAGNGSAGTANLETIVGCIISNNGGDGIEYQGGSSSAYGGKIVGNIITGNASLGINYANSTVFSTAEYAEHIGFTSNGNAFYNNGSGEQNIVPNGPDDITLTADPFVDAANGDFNLNNAAGGGAVLRGTQITL